MAWHLDIKGFHVSGSNKSGVCDFTAIVPVWDDISRHYGVYPINHVRIGGVAVPPFLFFDLLDARWHPDSPFYEEKWIEVVLLLCKYERDEFGSYLITESRSLKDRPENSWRYFVPAKQLLPLHRTEIKFRSEDRRKLICGI